MRWLAQFYINLRNKEMHNIHSKICWCVDVNIFQQNLTRSNKISTRCVYNYSKKIDSWLTIYHKNLSDSLKKRVFFFPQNKNVAQQNVNILVICPVIQTLMRIGLMPKNLSKKIVPDETYSCQTFTFLFTI